MPHSYRAEMPETGTAARLSCAPAPSFVLRVLMGEMADMVLIGQRVLPGKAQDSGYAFKYPNLYGGSH